MCVTTAAGCNRHVSYHSRPTRKVNPKKKDKSWNSETNFKCSKRIQLFFYDSVSIYTFKFIGKVLLFISSDKGYLMATLFPKNYF